MNHDVFDRSTQARLRVPAVLTALGAVFLLSGSLSAVDGVFEINQACAAVGCFPGDAAGLPVTIVASGSYRLTGNLTTNASDVIVVDVQASDVTLDLNGFAISGPTVCDFFADPPSCAPVGSGSAGISAGNSVERVRIGNGSVTGFSTCVSVPFASVGRGLDVTNCDIGIRVDSYSVVVDSTVRSVGFTGIDAGSSSGVEIRNNIVVGTVNDGIRAGNGGRVLENFVQASGRAGIFVAGFGAVIRENVISNAGVLDDGGDSSNGGIECSARCIVDSNTISTGDGVGISVGDDGIVHDNVVTLNDSFGLSLGSGVAYRNNTLRDNNDGNANPQVSGGIETGTNICGTNTTCP